MIRILLICLTVTLLACSTSDAERAAICDFEMPDNLSDRAQARQAAASAWIDDACASSEGGVEEVKAAIAKVLSARANSGPFDSYGLYKEVCGEPSPPVQSVGDRLNGAASCMIALRQDPSFAQSTPPVPAPEVPPDTAHDEVSELAIWIWQAAHAEQPRYAIDAPIQPGSLAMLADAWIVDDATSWEDVAVDLRFSLEDGTLEPEIADKLHHTFCVEGKWWED